MMNKLTNVLLIAGAALLLLAACNSPTEEDNEEEQNKKVVLNGQVLNKTTGNPVDSAVVQVLGISPTITIITDSQGKYRIEFEVENAREVQVVAFKESYLADTTTVLAVPDRVLEVPFLQLSPTGATPLSSGNAASIILFSQSQQSIGVRESGGVEQAQFIFEVQDSSGRPIDGDHAVEVNFTLGSSPGGGEFIHPATVITNNLGRAETYLFSGTIAGPVQIIAEIDAGNEIIRSRPVAIAIHGGLPDSIHFSVAVSKLNFPGYNIFGLTNGITAFVGDKYGNPVKPGTAVYFTTTGGIIEGSALTNNQGQASVNLISAAPKPLHPTLGAGFATVTAFTADENNNSIFTDAVVLFSGIPSISINPSTVNVPNGGSQTFIYTVSDQNGNPLAENTSINVSVTGDNIETSGTLNANLPDTQSPFWTSFSFTISDAADTVNVGKPVTVEITTSGPNGGALLNIGGIAF